MYKARKLKAFEWNSAKISNLSDGISSWQNIEYLKLYQTYGITNLPQDFGSLTNLKYLSFESVGLSQFHAGICNSNNLGILHIISEQITSIPLYYYFETIKGNKN